MTLTFSVISVGSPVITFNSYFSTSNAFVCEFLLWFITRI